MLNLTNREQDLLRFPGSVPGVLRRGSPVCAGMVGRAVSVGEDAGYSDGRIIVATPYKTLNTFCKRDLALDLTDATGRAHLAWWLAGNTVNMRYPSQTTGRFEPRTLCPGHWQVSTSDNFHPLTWSAEHVPSISALDPDDPRLLPDGSRLVDAIALSLVARHVAGLD
jgi:hypothetical protein